jgi:dUTPase
VEEMIEYAIMEEFLVNPDLNLVPSYSHNGPAGTMCFDMFLAEEATFSRTGTNGENLLLPALKFRTGVKFMLPAGLHLEWGGRSGNAFNAYRFIFEGKIDSEYIGEVAGLMYSLNAGDDNVTLPAGFKIGQIKVVDYRHVAGNDAYTLMRTSEAAIDFTETSRGSLGFGSTDGNTDSNTSIGVE